MPARRLRNVHVAVLTCLAFLLPTAAGATPAALHDDAGAGRDAGADATDPVEVGMGTHIGVLYYALGDRADWFHAESCLGVTVTVTTHFRTRVLVVGYSDAGGAPFWGSTNGEGLTFVLRGGSYRLGIYDPNGLGVARYQFTFAPVVAGDAGTLCDAPGSFSDAIDLTPGSYVGQLEFSAGDMEDWYRFTTPQATCLRVTWRATQGSLFGGMYADGGALIQNTHSVGESRILWAPPGAHRLGLGDSAGAGHAEYAFLAEAMAADAGLVCDAPPRWKPSLGIPLGSYTGRLDYAEGDDEDWYRVVVPEGESLEFTFRGTRGRVLGSIVTDGGVTVASAYSTGSVVTLHAGAGAYRLSIGDNTNVGWGAYEFTARGA